MRPRIAPALLLSALLSAGLAGACSADPDPVDLAHRAVARGDLERAETLLADVQGGAATSLRRRIDSVRTRREEIRAELAAIQGNVHDVSRAVAQRQIKELRRRAKDPVLEEELEVALSGLAELYQDAGRGVKLPDKRREDDRLAAAPPTPADRGASPEPVPTPSADGPARSAWDPYDRSQREPLAASEPTPVVAAAPAPAAPGTSGTTGTTGPTWERVQPTDGAPAPAPSAVRAFVTRARAALAEGRLADARTAYLDAAANAAYSVERDEFAGRARDVEDRLHLREEIASVFGLNAGRFEGLGLDAVDERGVTLGGVELAWAELELDLLERLASRANLSLRARLGWFQERLMRGDVTATWADLAEMVEAGQVDLVAASGIVGRYRGEFPPREGYVLRGGAWLHPREVAEAERAERIADAARDLRRAGPDERDALVALLREEDAEEELLEALEERWDDANARLAKDRTLDKLAKVAEARAALDAARETALELIFDEEEYFYPYTPPECPPERAKDYPAVQRRVTELVNAVEDAWEAPVKVALNDKFRASLDEILWSRALQADLGVAFGDGGDTADAPTWFDGIDPSLEVIGLAEFAWDAEERLQHAYSRAVQARNERMFADPAATGIPDELVLDAHEAEQVRITNAYRLMFGRRALAWNPRIHAAAEDHSDYMSRTGDFGHFEPDPETRTPNDRMGRRGYDAGVSENCHMGGGDPMGAHVGWTRSSGHHRNLLMEGHREMASALAGPFWTQNFGRGLDFLLELPEEVRGGQLPPGTGRGRAGGLSLPGSGAQD